MALHRRNVLTVAAILVAAASATSANAQGQPQAHWDDDGGNACVLSFERAQRARLHGELVEARARLPECLADTCPARVRDDCTRMRVDLDGAIPTAAFAVRDASGIDLDASVSVDGTPVEVEGGRATAINPGPHVVTYTLPGEAPRTTNVRLYEGEKSRLIILTARAQAHRAESLGSDADSAHHTSWPFVIGGAGVLLAATSIFFVVRANAYAAEGREASRSVPAGVGPCQDFGGIPADPRFCEANKNRTTATSLAIASGAAGAVALGSAAVLWLLESRPRAGGPSRAARFVPAIGPTTAGASMDMTF